MGGCKGTTALLLWAWFADGGVGLMLSADRTTDAGLNDDEARDVEDTGVDVGSDFDIPWWESKDPLFSQKLEDTIERRHAEVSEAHKRAAMRSSRPPSKIVNIAISLTENDRLPDWSEYIINGSWGKDTSLTAYIKTSGVARDQEVVLERGRRLERVAIPSLGRNEHAYVWHLARKYKALADVQILTKTNRVTAEMIRSLIAVAQNGSYGFLSHPWVFRRRYLNVRCDTAWQEHELYHEFCGENRTGGRFGGAVPSKHFKTSGEAMIIKSAAVDPRGDAYYPLADLHWALGTLQEPLPFMHETFGEGTFMIRRDVLRQYPEDWYLTWKAEAYKRVGPGYEGYHHDVAMMEIFPLLFSKEDGLTNYPAYHVSASTVDLY